MASERERRRCSDYICFYVIEMGRTVQVLKNFEDIEIPFQDLRVPLHANYYLSGLFLFWTLSVRSSS